MVPQIECLRKKILKILEIDLGEYVFANGKSVPAISIDNNGEYPPSGTKITGLECVIIPLNNLIATRMCGSKQIKYQSDILLKQWDSTKNLIRAVEKLIAGLPEISRVGPRLLANGDLQSIEQQRIVIEINEIIRWDN